VPGVVPRSAGQHRMRFRRMRGQGRVDRVYGVETGVEADRVVTVARQRADAVVVGGSHGFGDGR
jgi:hypothetical protein